MMTFPQNVLRRLRKKKMPNKVELRIQTQDLRQNEKPTNLESFVPWALLLLTGCTENPSILFKLAGPHAQETKNLFWFIVNVEIIVWVLVLGTLFYFLNKRKTSEVSLPGQPSAQTERKLTF